MENEFDEIMKQHSDAELMEILNSEPGDYLDSAMESARREFKSRKLSAEKIKEINEEIEQEKYEQEVAFNTPANKPSKLLAFFLPGLWRVYLSDGSQKDQDLATYTLYGFVFYGCVFAFIMIIDHYFHWHF